MTSIHGVTGPIGPGSIEPVNTIGAAQPAADAAMVNDVVEISTIARLAAKVQEIPDVRAELVQRVKAEIAAGTYETPERLEIAVSRLMDEFISD